MTEQYRRVVGDTEADIEDQLLVTLSDGTTRVEDISGFQTVTFHLEKPDGSVSTATDSGAVTVLDSPNGIVEYQLQDGDLDQQGRYRYEWQVTYGDGEVLSFPSDGLGEVWVREDLG